MTPAGSLNLACPVPHIFCEKWARPRERLDGRLGLSLSCAISHDSRELRNLGNPPPILFLIKFNLKIHGASTSCFQWSQII